MQQQTQCKQLVGTEQPTTANIGAKFVPDAQLVNQMKMLPIVVGQMARYGQTFFHDLVASELLVERREHNER